MRYSKVSFLLQIENVYIPDTYRGHDLFMQSDLAVVIVKDVIEFSNFVHAICVDFDPLYAKLQLSPGKIGRVGYFFYLRHLKLLRCYLIKIY